MALQISDPMITGSPNGDTCSAKGTIKRSDYDIEGIKAGLMDIMAWPTGACRRRHPDPGRCQKPEPCASNQDFGGGDQQHLALQGASLSASLVLLQVPVFLDAFAYQTQPHPSRGPVRRVHSLISRWCVYAARPLARLTAILRNGLTSPRMHRSRRA